MTKNVRKKKGFFSVPSVTPKNWGLIGQKFYLLSGNSNRVTLLDDNLWPSANKDLIYWGQHITYCFEQTYADITEKIIFS